jgi:hypothetical protein
MTIEEASAELDVTQKHVMRLIRELKLRATLTKAGWTVQGRDVRRRRRERTAKERAR